MPPVQRGVVRQTEGGERVLTLRQRLGARDLKLILMGSDNLLKWSMGANFVEVQPIPVGREAVFQVSSLISRYVSPNSFPFALNVSPGRSRHFSNRRGLFFRCSNAEATTSACGISGYATTEKHADSPRCEMRSPNNQRHWRTPDLTPCKQIYCRRRQGQFRKYR